MNTFSTKTLEKRHLRLAVVRKLAIASCLGGFLTFAVGAWILPWLGAIGVWLIHRIPWWHVAGSFPNLLDFIAAPHMVLGLIWLIYYIAAYVWATVSFSPRQRMQLLAKWDREYRETYGEWSFSGYYYDRSYYQPARKKEEAPLSQAWPGELKHQLVEHCYEEYKKALKRFDPPPLTLRVPETFQYRKAGQIDWDGSTLILPEAVLTPERIHELLPFLAHFLYDYNAESITEEETTDFPDHVPFAPLLCATGNFLWLPVAWKHGMEERTPVNDVAQQKQRVLDRDEFAVLLGQGPALEHQLRRMDEELNRRGEIDRSIPTLTERIGRLSVLNEKERQDMRALGLTPKEPPLVINSPFLQIRKGKKPKQ